MKFIKLFTIAIIFFAACSAPQTNTNTTNKNTSPAPQVLTETERPQKIKDMSRVRGEQDNAKPELKILFPKADSTITNSTVKVQLALSGDLKGYKPMKDMATQMGNHVHIILDNEPYEAFYNVEDNVFDLKNVADGEHTLRVFPSRPWHESYKNEGAFQMIKFTVKNGGADTSKPVTTNSGNKMSNTQNTNVNSAPTPESKEMKPSKAGAVDPAKPLLTYSRPKGEYKGADTEAIMIDFWLLNAVLKGDGGTYRVRYSIDGGEAKFIDTWQPIWLKGFGEGKHKIKLELVDTNGAVVENGGYNTTEREIMVMK